MTTGNENLNNSQGENVEDLKKIFEDIQNSSAKSKKPTREEKLSKIFTPRKNKEVFRPLPPLEGKPKVDVAFFHPIPTNSVQGKKNRKLYCPAHNDPRVPKLDDEGNPIKDQTGKVVTVPAPCPLCAKYDFLIKKQNNSIKNIKAEDLTPEQVKIKEINDKIYKEATKWQAKKFYIVRGIDKGAEKDGVKFWRFKHNFKKQGVMDKLGPALNDFMNQYNVAYYDPKEGTDLSITVTDAEFMNKPYKEVSAISNKGKSKLHEDEYVVKQWLGDKVTWRQVFTPATAPVITPLEFLELASKGEDPYWDDTDIKNKHWVFPNHSELEVKANTRDAATSKDRDAYFEQASDLVDEEDIITSVTVSSKDTGTTFKNDATNVMKEVKKVKEKVVEDFDADELPF